MVAFVPFSIRLIVVKLAQYQRGEAKERVRISEAHLRKGAESSNPFDDGGILRAGRMWISEKKGKGLGERRSNCDTE